MTAPTREDRATTSDATAGLTQLNALDDGQARAAFLAFAGSQRWAAAMADGRPYRDLAHLLDAADRAFDTLQDSDWRQAFAAHSPIGAPAPDDARGAVEQSALGALTPAQRAALIDGNERYRRRFGHVFLIRAAGRSATETLAALRTRLQNDVEAELAVAAREQRAITRLRLGELDGT